MKKVILKRLVVENFKGIGNLDIKFNDDSTLIEGANGAGKTSTADAVSWLLFGKDSSGKAQFGIFPTDVEGTIIKGLSPTVTGVFSINGEELTLSKFCKQKWSGRRGEEGDQLTGSSNSYEVNGTPYSKEKDYRAIVDEIISEDLFKLLSSLTHFHSLHWTDRRKVFTQIAGVESDEDIIKKDPKHEVLLKILNKGKTLEQYRLELTKNKKGYNDDKALIPPAINEHLRELSEWKSIDFKSLEDRKNEIDGILEKITIEENDIKKNAESVRSEMKSLQDTITSNESNLSDLLRTVKNEHSEKIDKENKASRDYNDKKREIESEIERQEAFLSRYNADSKRIESEISSTELELVETREKFKTTAAREFIIDENNLKCYACGETLSDYESKAIQLEKEFNDRKASDLASVRALGKELGSRVEDLKNELEVKTNYIKGHNESLASHKSALSELVPVELKINTWEQKDQDAFENRDDVKSIKSVIADTEQKYEILSTEESKGFRDRSAEKNEFLSEKSTIQVQLSRMNDIKNKEERIESLRSQERTLANQIAKIEQFEILIDDFQAEKIAMVQDKVNALFDKIKIRMFEIQNNGEIKDSCTTLSDGVPYEVSLNMASKVNAGLEVIKVLSDFYKTYVPVFVDNKESVHYPIEMNTQMIYLQATIGKQFCTLINPLKQ